MKTFFIICALLLVAVTADLEAERNKYHKTQEDCEKEHGEPKNLLHKILKGEDIGDEDKAAAMALCFGVKMGQLNEQGEVIVENYKEHARLMNKDENRVNKLLGDCGKKVGDTPEKAALNFIRCAINYKPKL